MSQHNTRVVAVSGATGLVGQALTAALVAENVQVLRLVRRPAQNDQEIEFRPDAGILDAQKLSGVEAIVHLAGENIASRRWSQSQKDRIRTSRVQSTEALSQAIARLPQPLPTFIAASAIGFYGDRGDEVLTESSTSGSGFLAEVCRDWEAATQPASQTGARVVNLRTGVVLARDGGALTKMLTPFKLGAGGRIGSGRQYWSWIALVDLVRIIQFAIRTAEIVGPINCVAPQPVTNDEFTKVLGRVLRRPTIFPMPAFMARLMLGEMANELLLASQRVQPTILLAAKFEFQLGNLELALRSILQ